MKFKPFASRMLPALLGSLLVCSNQSEAALSYTDGDLLLSFRATGGTGGSIDYILDLGNASQFVNAVNPIVLDTEIGNLKADLDFYFGSSWQTRVDFMWSVSGVQRFADANFATNQTLFASRAHSANLTLGVKNSTAWNRGSEGALATPELSMESMGLAYQDGTAPGIAISTNTLTGLIQPQSNTNSYRAFMPGGASTTGSTAFSYFNNSAFEGKFGAGSNGFVLDLYQVTAGTGAADFEGTFSIDNNAVVTFTPTAVPEPTSIAALAGGFAVLASVRRRRENQ